MTMKVKTNSDTLAHPELGAVGDLVVVLGLHRNGCNIGDDVVVVATLVSSTGKGVGPGVISIVGSMVGSIVGAIVGSIVGSTGINNVETSAGAVVGFGDVGEVIGVSPKIGQQLNSYN